MPSYTVKKPCRPDGRTYMTEGEIELTEKQAKYPLLYGQIEPKSATRAKTTKKSETE